MLLEQEKKGRVQGSRESAGILHSTTFDYTPYGPIEKKRKTALSPRAPPPLVLKPNECANIFRKNAKTKREKNTTLENQNQKGVNALPVKPCIAKKDLERDTTLEI
jgi:hypothetical protein